MVEILHHAGTVYGYQMSKLHSQLFPPATRRVIYYHLKKGIETGEFEIGEVKRETGDFSWGSVVEKTYYTLGKNAKPKGNPQVKEFFERTKG